MESEEPQDPQMILRDPLQRVADEPHPPRCEVLATAEVIVNLTADRVGEQGVDSEVAPRGIFLPVIGEGHGCTAPVRRHVTAQGGDLHRLALADGSDSAVLDAGGNRPDARGRQAFHDGFGPQFRSKVDIADGKPQQLVAHGSPDVAREAFARAKRSQQRGDARTRTPGVCIQLHCHCSRRDRFTSIAAVAPQIRRPAHSIS
jgi:hypothetical protein